MTRVFFMCVTGVPVILKEFDLTGKKAIVTGAARRGARAGQDRHPGIGRPRT